MTTWLGFALFCCASTAAAASSYVCEYVDPGYVNVDGMLDDWQELGSLTAGAKSKDRSLAFRCVYDDRYLYLSFDVRDQTVFRSSSATQKRDDDQLVVRVGVSPTFRTIVIRPGANKKAPVYATSARGTKNWEWKNQTGSKAPAWLTIEDTLQPRGFSAELRLSRSKLPRTDKGTPGIDLRLVYRDVDRRGQAATKLPLSARRLYYAAGARLFRSFLKSLGLQRRDVSFDSLSNVAGGPGAERLLLAGKYIGVLSNRFSFIQLPVDSAADVISAARYDFDSDGRSSILVHYRQRGSTWTREVVGVWRVDAANTFQRTLAFEVKKQRGQHSLDNSWSIVPRGTRRKLARGARKSGFDILVTAGRSRGWDEDNYGETPANDMKPILLPWMDDTAVLYSIDGGNVGTHKPLPKR